MKSPWHIGKVLRLAVLLLACSTGVARAQAVSTAEQPSIIDIQLEGTNVLITARVPAGLKRLILQGSQALGTAAWQPRAVIRLDGQGGLVTFQVGRSPELEMIRVRADETDPLPLTFYSGTNNFKGALLSSSTYNDLVAGPIAFGANDSRAGTETAPVADARTVVESDIWKVDGNTLYFFNQYRGLQVIDVSNPDAPVLRGTLPLPAVGEQMYVLPDHTVVLLARNNCTGGDAGGQVLLVNTLENQPRVSATLPINGSLQESRMVGTALYVMGQTYRQVVAAKDGTWEWGTSVQSFDLSNPAAPVTRPDLWYSGYGNVLSATDQFLFVSVQDNSGNSLVRCTDISSPDGTMKKAGTVKVAGTITDKFKINLDGTVLTVISEKWSSSSALGRWAPVTTLETFSLNDPNQPAKLGQLRLADGEQLHATRFDGNRVYIVTYFRVDPLWVVDLSDPAKPAIKGELKVPGWSTYIQPLGDRLLTIGIDDTNGWRVAVSLFDVHDPAAPALLSKVPLGENSSWSEANSDEKAFGFLPDAGLILVPYGSYSTNYQEGVQLIDYSNDALKKRGFISHAMQARRSTLVKDRILSISARELLSVDAADRDHPIVRSSEVLAWSVDRVFSKGGYLVELENSSSYGYNTAPVVRVVSAAAPDVILRTTALTNLPVFGATERDGRLYILQGVTTYGSPILFEGDAKVDQTPTNETSLVCSVIDLSNLPELGAVRSDEMKTSEVLYGNAEAAWPKSDLLVWAMQQANYWFYFRGFPTTGVMDSIVTRTTAGAGVALAPIIFRPWYPYGTYGDSKLYAVDVKDPLAPRFVSETKLASTNGWSSYSKPFAADNSLYLSQDVAETTITSTNFVVITNQIYVLATNTVVVTNYVKIPHEITETNVVTGTNVVVGVVKNKLGDLTVLSSDAQVIAGGAYHTLALAENGRVWAWGGNTDGQSGVDSLVDQLTPRELSGLNSLISIAGGSLHSLALRSDGTVWAWGNDAFGQLGNASAQLSPDLPPLPELGGPNPVQVAGLKGIRAVVAGAFHSLALQSDGPVWAWGGNWDGQLGDGSFNNAIVPVPVAGLPREITQVAAGAAHSLALAKDGSVWSWGANDSGQLGDESKLNRNVPEMIKHLQEVQALASGHSHNLALKKDGTVWAWGLNESGQVGVGSFETQPAPVQVQGLSDIVAIACGQRHSLALARDGTVWAWGRNKDVQVTSEFPSQTTTPKRVPLLPACRGIAAGENHSLAVSAAGDLYAWGKNDHGQLGNGEVLFQTNVYTGTNYFTSTTWTVDMEVVLRTNRVKVLQDVVVTNEQPVYTTRQYSFLHVIDYASPSTPFLRAPVSIPGSLRGVSHGGAVVYLVGTDLKSDAADGVERLHACSYDGVACYLVDTHLLPKDWPHPLLVRDPYIYITRPQVEKTSTSAVEVWRLTDDGKFSKLGERPLGSNTSLLLSVADVLITQEDSGVELFDLHSPIELPQIGKGAPAGCVGWNVEQASGSAQEGLWLPLGLYGVDHIEIRR